MFFIIMLCLMVAIFAYLKKSIEELEKDGHPKADSVIRMVRGFVGVYSGRIGEGEIHAQLGIVWKKEVIDEIINGKVKGNINFHQKKC